MRKKQKIYLLVAIIVLAVLGIATYSHHHVKKQQAMQPMVITHPVIVKMTTPQTNLVGSVVAINQTTITSKTDGYISKILFKEGQFVKVGTELLELDNSKIRAKLVADQVSLEMAGRQFQRDTILVEKGFVTKQDKETDHVALAAKQATVNEDRQALSDTIITAPFDGYLGANNLSIGEYVTAGQALVQLVDRDHLEVQYAVPASDAFSIKLGDKVQLTSSLLPNQTFNATITFIAPAIDSTTRTVAVHAQIDDPNHQLLSGEFLNVEQSLGASSSVIYIPEEAVVPALEGYSVFIVNNNTAKKIPVTLGEHKDGLVEVIQGLSRSDVVITQGQDSLQDGQNIKAYAKPSITNK